MDCTFTISLVRHARTRGNLEKRYVGWTDEPIVEKKLPVIDAKKSLVYGSDLIRCQQSAKGYYPHAEFIAMEALRESNFGDYEMATYEDLKDKPLYRRWIEEPEKYSPPNGENLVQMSERIARGIQSIPQARQWDFVIHGGTIRALLVRYSPQPSAFWDWHITHDERYILTFDSFEQFKEGHRCKSLSVERITVKENM